MSTISVYPHSAAGLPCGSAKPPGSSSEDPAEQGDLDLEEEIETREPSKCAVFLLNDDYTTMEFVIDVLCRFFKKTPDEAMAITLKVHREGRGLAGIYTFEIAETKVYQVESTARARGFPLTCAIEPIDSTS